MRTDRRDNPTWGSPHIQAELAKLGIEVSDSTVRKYRPRTRKPPSQNWRTFLKNHASDIVAIDFFVVPTVTFKLLYVFVVLVHDRRRIVHFNVTASPSAQWAGQQVVEAFPYNTAPGYLLRDRDRIYGTDFARRVSSMGIEQVVTAYRSPWQNVYALHCTSSVLFGRTSAGRRLSEKERNAKQSLGVCYSCKRDRPKAALRTIGLRGW
jgi:hypothetical protein